MTKVLTVHIHVRPDSNSQNGYAFEMKENGSTKNRLVFDKNQDNMPKTENYRVDFQLHNEKGANLRFSSLADKAMWAKPIANPSDPCPDSECHMPGIFYLDPANPIEDRKISVINTDLTHQLFAFAMNFVPEGTVEGPDTQYICYDPIGENRNGGRLPTTPTDTLASSSSTTGLLVVAGVVIVALAIAVFR